MIEQDVSRRCTNIFRSDAMHSIVIKMDPCIGQPRGPIGAVPCLAASAASPRSSRGSAEELLIIGVIIHIQPSHEFFHVLASTPGELLHESIEWRVEGPLAAHGGVVPEAHAPVVVAHREQVIDALLGVNRNAYTWIVRNSLLIALQ